MEDIGCYSHNGLQIPYTLSLFASACVTVDLSLLLFALLYNESMTEYWILCRIYLRRFSFITILAKLHIVSQWLLYIFSYAWCFILLCWCYGRVLKTVVCSSINMETVAAHCIAHINSLLSTGIYEMHYYSSIFSRNSVWVLVLMKLCLFKVILFLDNQYICFECTLGDLR